MLRYMSICFTRFQNQVYAILNWKFCDQDRKDGLILKKLSAEETKAYENQRQSGRSDSGIFQQLFPPRPVFAANDRINESIFLNRNQIADIINQKLNTSLKTLTNMSIEDLRVLLVQVERLGSKRT
jgi:hypothetical protein